MKQPPRPIPPSRQVHLDFHTSPWIPDVGAAFDARSFARAFKEAHVNSVTLFAKCHHGHLYYDTKRPERHPGLRPGLDLLGEQIEALRREGIRAPIYLSVQCDEYAADNQPHWVARQDDGKPVGAGPFTAGWQVLDMSSPYQEYLVEQTREVLRRFRPVDGVFFDMCWDQPSVSHFAVEKMLAAGLSPDREFDRMAHAHGVSLAYMARLHAMVKESSPCAGVFFNSRQLANLQEELPFQEQVEIEALPTGGWGYLYFGRNARFVRTFGKPYIGMTARFHKGWADFGGLKPYAALEYETSQMMAHGAGCSIGDQLHPRGNPDPAAYELIGKVYARVEEREPWLAGARPAAQVGLLQLPGAAHRTGYAAQAGGSEEGATRLLTQIKAQFDVVSATAAWSRYDVLILPDCVAVTAQLAGRLRQHLARGGAVLASGTSGLSADGREVLFPELGVTPAGGTSPFQTTYIRFGPEIRADVPATDHVMYERGVRVTAESSTLVLAGVVEPYFERSWRHFSSHCQTPPDALSPYAAATLCTPGDSSGRVAYVAYPIFAAFAQHGNWTYRLLVRNILEQLLPDPLLRVGAPTSTEATVTRQEASAANPARTIVHLLQYCPERRTKSLDLVEDVVWLYDIPLSLRLGRPPRRVYLAPEMTGLDFEYARGRTQVTVPEVRGHAMVVFEESSDTDEAAGRSG